MHYSSFEVLRVSSWPIKWIMRQFAAKGMQPITQFAFWNISPSLERLREYLNCVTLANKSGLCCANKLFNEQQRLPIERPDYNHAALILCEKNHCRSNVRRQTLGKVLVFGVLNILSRKLQYAKLFMVIERNDKVSVHQMAWVPATLML